MSDNNYTSDVEEAEDVEEMELMEVDLDDSGSEHSDLEEADSGQCNICGEDYTYMDCLEHQWCKSCQINDLIKNFANWTSGNEEIDDFIQEMQLNIDSYDDIIFEWIPYNQLNDITEGTGKAIMYSAIWKDGPLEYDIDIIKYKRNSNKKVALKCLHGSQIITNEFLNNEVNAYSNDVYGISQNPDTKDYIMVLQDVYCECGKKYKDTRSKWCQLCQENYLKNFINETSSGNEEIDNLIQEKQLQINGPYDIVFEWIPYDQFNAIKKMGKDDSITIYSAIWKVGPLDYDTATNKYKRLLDMKVTLKCLHINSQSIINEILNEVDKYPIVKHTTYPCEVKIYGISQNPETKDYIMVLENEYCDSCGERYTNPTYKWCKPCQINYLKDFTNGTSGDGNIDNFIQKMQLEIIYPWDTVFEWIPYNQFNNIKEIGESDFATVYSAIWKDGPIDYDMDTNKYKRLLNKEVALKYLYNPQNIIDEIKNEIEKHNFSLISDVLKIYGISQNPDTRDYIVVLQNGYCKCGEIYTYVNFKWCKSCLINYLKKNLKNWTSGSKKINDLIQEKQLQINGPYDIVFEWIPYNQFNNIKEIGKDGDATVYSAIWEDGPYDYDTDENKYKWISDIKVTLKYLCNSQNVTDEALNEVKVYSIDKNDDTLKIYGISQNPDTKDYIMVFQDGYCKCGEKYIDIESEWCKSCQINDLKKKFKTWTSGNENIDNLIQEMQLKINTKWDTVFEWIPYDQFNDIKEIGKGGFATVYSAIWKDGPLHYSQRYKRYHDEEKVALKCLKKSQNITKEFLNEVKAYSMNIFDTNNILNIYGMSQHPDTKDYIMVLEYAEGGTLKDHIYENYKRFNWEIKLSTLADIIYGLNTIHQKLMVHRDFHGGNILFRDIVVNNDIYISDMGLCGDVNNTDKTKIYGVMPYVAPEVLDGKPYTQAADIYSFGMIMYFVATGKQPFSDYKHDRYLILGICSGTRPEINEPEAPNCYIDLMKKCWDSNPRNRPNAMEIYELINLFIDSYTMDAFGFEKIKLIQKEQHHYEIENQFGEAEEYRKSVFLSSIENRQPINAQAIYVSRVLNPDIQISDDTAVEQLLLQHLENQNNNNEFSEFSDGMAVEQFLLQNLEQLD